MNTLRIAAKAVPAVIATLLLACAPERPAEASTTRTEAATPAGHYCNLGVFTPQEHARLENTLAPKFVAAVTETEELENGYTVPFSGQFKEAGEWLDLVRRCCSTLDYQLAFDAHGGPASLRITGTAGAKAFIREEFRPLFHKAG